MDAPAISWAARRFPKCRGTRSMPTGVLCPKDGGEIAAASLQEARQGVLRLRELSRLRLRGVGQAGEGEVPGVRLHRRRGQEHQDARGHFRKCLKCENEWDVAAPEERGRRGRGRVAGAGRRDRDSALHMSSAAASPAARPPGSSRSAATRWCCTRCVRVRGTAAHKTDRLAELVCSNTFKSTEVTNAHGLLKAEMRALGSHGARRRRRGARARRQRAHGGPRRLLARACTSACTRTRASRWCARR